MFRTPRPNLIESDDGFSVERKGRSEIVYREGTKELSAWFEFLTGATAVTLAKATIRAWRPPHASEAISSEEQARIAGNIAEALHSQGLNVEIVDAGVSEAWAPNSGATAPKDGRLINGKFRNSVTEEASLLGVRWDTKAATWVTPFDKVVGDEWSLEAWGEQPNSEG